MALTDIQIKNAKTPEKKIKLTEGAGIYLLLHPDGSKYWRMQYRFDGKQKPMLLVSIPLYPFQKLVKSVMRPEQ